MASKPTENKPTETITPLARQGGSEPGFASPEEPDDRLVRPEDLQPINTDPQPKPPAPAPLHNDEQLAPPPTNPDAEALELAAAQASERGSSSGAKAKLLEAAEAWAKSGHGDRAEVARKAAERF